MSNDTPLADAPEIETVETQVNTNDTPETETSEPSTDANQEGEISESSKAVEAKPEQKQELTEAEKIKYGMQKRIDRQTAKNAQMEREIAELRSLVEKSQPAKQSDEPQENQFETTEEYLIAKGKHEARKEYEAANAKAKQDVEAREYNEKVAKIRQAFEVKETEFRKTTPDYDDAVSVVNDYIGTAPKDSMHVAVFRDFIMESDNPAPLLYRLGRDPEIIESMTEMTPMKFARALVRLEMELENAPKQVATKTATPPSPVKGTTSGQKKLDEMSYTELRKALKL